MDDCYSVIASEYELPSEAARELYDGGFCCYSRSGDCARPFGVVMKDPTEDYEGQVLVCGKPGSLILYNGSVWHGHPANLTDAPRRSIQGAYIRRDAKSFIDQAARIRPETLARISPLAKYLLSV